MSSGSVGKTFDGFESLKHWSKIDQYGKVAQETKDVEQGSGALKLTTPKSEPYVGVYKPMGVGGQDFRGKNFSAAVKVKSPQVSKLSLELFAPNSGRKLTMTRTFTGPTNRWMRVDFGVTNAENNPNLKRVQKMRLIARGRGGENEKIEMLVDDLRTVDRPKNGYVFLTFDDTHITHYTKAYKMMQQYGFPGVEGAIPELVYGENRLNTSQLHKLREAGWDVASHPFVGGESLPERSKSEQKKLIRKSKDWLDSQGFKQGSRVFVTPKSLMGPNTWDLVQEYHDVAFRFGGSPNGLPISAPHNLSRINGESVKTAKRMIDLAGKYRQNVTLRYGIIGEDGISEKDFRSTLDYIKQKKNVKVSTPTKLLKQQEKW